MINLRQLRDDAGYRAGAEAKGASSELIEELLAAESSRRELLQVVEGLRAEQNAASKAIGKASPEERPERIKAAGELKAALGAKEDELAPLADQVKDLSLQIPNPAHPSVPVGGEDAFETIKTVGEPNDAPQLDHAAYGEKMGFFDQVTASKVSGSRFAYIMREAVLLEFALAQWVMSKLIESDFIPVAPPVLVNEQMMIDAGFFPTDRNQVYEMDADDLFLVGTAEVPLAGLHRGEHLQGDDLPLRYAGYSSCFRREAGTYGKDTRGLFRVHQFNKVEMFSYVEPDKSWDELDRILAIEEDIYSSLGFPYRVIAVASGDLGAAAAKKFDIEVWLPSEGRYRELTSCSNYTDFSARRMSTRVKGEKGNEYLHTLNGTACAISRTLVFLFEHCQQPDGSFVVPEVLRPYCGGLEVIAPR